RPDQRPVPNPGPPFTGVPLQPVTADLSQYTAVEFVLRAPQGQWFDVALGPGVVGSFGVFLHYQVTGGLTISPLGEGFRSIWLDDQDITASYSIYDTGVDPLGQAIRVNAEPHRNEASQVIHPHTASFTFERLTVRLDFGSSIDTSGASLQTLLP